MELGACFRSYDEFQECFRAYKLAQGFCYGLRSCVSVRCHNRQHGTAVREDVVFMQVTFGCARAQTYSTLRKQRTLCPAHFVLQYNEDVDLLVVSELNSNHIHADSVYSRPGAAPMKPRPAARNNRTAEQHPRRWAGGSDSDDAAGEGSAAEQLLDGAPAPCGAPVLPEAEKENASASVLIRVAEVMKSLLRADRGSLASISVADSRSLDRLSFQTSRMKSSLVQFPERLLLHRVPGEGGRVLYAFLVESGERAGKVVHLSLLKHDTGHGVRKMLTIFKEFNPEWQKVQAVFVDVFFSHRAVLRELFPSAQVLLSVYHAVRLLEKNVKEAEVSSSLKQNVALALQEAMFSPSAASLDTLSQVVKHVASPELYDNLRANWFFCEPLWHVHEERGPRSCSAHMDSLDLITHRMATLFGQQPSLEASVLRFLEHADGLDSRGSESLDQDSSSTEEDGRGSLQEKPDAHASASAEPGPVSGSPALAKHPEAAVAGPGRMLAALRDCGTGLGYWLCLKEWEVVRASTQLLGPAPGTLTVWLQEDPHRVSQDCQSCSCCFHRRYRLPCRHVLAVLRAHRGRVEEGMVCRRWQKRYQYLLAPAASLLGGGGASGSVGGRPEGRGERVRSLSLELATLLARSEAGELEQRSSALAAILAAWDRPPGAGKEPVPPHCSG
ncbi:zinc finger SWIM domain-containing protein 3 [Leptosomus discolor]